MYVIGLDIGTTCTKALLADDKGNVLGVGSSGYKLVSNGCKIEQSAQDWIDAAILAVKEVMQGQDASQVAGISMSTQGGSTVAVDAEGNFIGNAVTWMDTRSTKEVEEIEAELGGEYVYRTSGWKLNPALDCAKQRNLKKDPAYAGVKKFLSTVEVMNGYLTGNAVIDPTNAAIRQLYNVEENCWDEKLLAAANTTVDELPEVLPGGAKVGGLTREAAEAMGLPEGIPVFNGAHDQYCASIGGGVVNEGDMLLSAGTTWVLMGVNKKPMISDTYIAPGKHPVGGLYGAMVSLTCSGAALQWYKDGFLPEDFKTMNEEAAKRQEKTKDLFFYPYQVGANYPIWNHKAKGAFTGITLEHDRIDFARAIMEGVAFGVKRGVLDFQKNGCDIKQITMMGGASKSPLWIQMIADITNVPILRLNQADICAVGAAMIAACGLGIYKDYTEAAKAMVHTEQVYEPNPENVAFYAEKFARFDKMWSCMQQYYQD